MPICQLIRRADHLEIRLTFPGFRSGDLNERELYIEALMRHYDEGARPGVQNPSYWEVASNAVAGQFKRLSRDHEALVLSLDLQPLMSNRFGLLLAVTHSLEEQRKIDHRVQFNVTDLHRVQGPFGWREHYGTFGYEAVTDIAEQLNPIDRRRLRERDLVQPND